ncbi:hypothetical protein TNCV_4491941 [Trichonephila clavipes]|nr:hypothetical protein TNCV_4491941 [Trichonephila clavipes]
MQAVQITEDDANKRYLCRISNGCPYCGASLSSFRALGAEHLQAPLALAEQRKSGYVQLIWALPRPEPQGARWINLHCHTVTLDACPV